MRVRLSALGVVVALGVAFGSAASGWSAHGQTEGTIATVAGNGVEGSTGDGGPATAAAIAHPRGIAVLSDGSIVFAQPFIPMVRRVRPDGTITTVVGSENDGYSGDGGPASQATLNLAHGVAALPDGGFVVADMGNNRIRRVWPDGRITTIVGTGLRGFSGDGGPATAAMIGLPRGVAARPDGELLIPDTANQRVRRVSLDGTITTVAGNGIKGFSGDGGPATAAELNRPFSVSPLPDGGFLVAEVDNHRIRRVRPDGTITTVAGDGVPGYSGDGGLATVSSLNQPHAVAALPDGGFLIADTYNHRVRRVRPNGTITTVAGTGEEGFSGDGGPATAAALDLPKALALLPDLSGFLVGDAANNRIRLVRLDLHPPLVFDVARRIFRVRAGHPAVLRFTLSEKAVVRVTVVRGGAVVLQARDHGKAGGNVLAFGVTLRPGTYAVRMRATTSDGRSVARAGSLTIVGRKPARLAAR